MTETRRHPALSLRDQTGAAAVEFALVLPIFLLLLLGMVDFGRIFNYWIDGTHLSHTGARYAAVGKNPGPAGTLADSIKAQGDTDELRNGSDSVTTALKVCVSFPNGKAVGEPVVVSADFTYKFLGYINSMAPGLTSKTVTNTSTMRIEKTPTFSAHCSA